MQLAHEVLLEERGPREEMALLGMMALQVVTDRMATLDPQDTLEEKYGLFPQLAS